MFEQFVFFWLFVGDLNDADWDCIQSVDLFCLCVSDVQLVRNLADIYISECFSFHIHILGSAAICQLKLNNNCFARFVAGYETTATFLRWCMVYMILHPEVQAKVQAEIEAVVGPFRQPTITDESNMPYTKAVITEVHRISSFVPFAVPHCTTEDMELEGFHIPKGTSILFLLNHHESRLEKTNSFTIKNQSLFEIKCALYYEIRNESKIQNWSGNKTRGKYRWNNLFLLVKYWCAMFSLLTLGTEVWPMVCHHFMNPAVWGDPETFRPERFLDQNEKLIGSLVEEVQPYWVGELFIGAVDLCWWFIISSTLFKCPTPVVYFEFIELPIPFFLIDIFTWNCPHVTWLQEDARASESHWPKRNSSPSSPRSCRISPWPVTPSPAQLLSLPRVKMTSDRTIVFGKCPVTFFLLKFNL